MTNQLTPEAWRTAIDCLLNNDAPIGKFYDIVPPPEHVGQMRWSADRQHRYIAVEIEDGLRWEIFSPSLLIGEGND